MANYLYGGALIKPSQGNEGILANLFEFDQKEFFEISTPAMSSMDDIGYVYVPTRCAAGALCKLHIAFHGCQQGRQLIGNTYVLNAGYLEVAELNDIIVLFPQVVTSALSNPQGCWDWWGWVPALLLHCYSIAIDILLFTLLKQVQQQSLWYVIYSSSSILKLLSVDDCCCCFFIIDRHPKWQPDRGRNKDDGPNERLMFYWLYSINISIQYYSSLSHSYCSFESLIREGQTDNWLQSGRRLMIWNRFKLKLLRKTCDK